MQSHLPYASLNFKSILEFEFQIFALTTKILRIYGMQSPSRKRGQCLREGETEMLSLSKMKWLKRKWGHAIQPIADTYGSNRSKKSFSQESWLKTRLLDSMWLGPKEYQKIGRMYVGQVSPPWVGMIGKVGSTSCSKRCHNFPPFVVEKSTYIGFWKNIS